MLFGQGSAQRDGGPADLGASGRYYDGTKPAQSGFGTVTRVDKGVFTHIAVTNDGAGTLRTYVNGEPKATASTTRTTAANADDPGPLHIGSASTGKPFVFAGLIDEVRISGVARYGAETFTPARRWESDADTIVLFHFDEGEGSVTKDEAGQRIARVNGATWARIACGS
jgi:hypothetical protein